MRKLLLATLLACCLSATSFADRQEKIKLDNQDRMRETVDYDGFRIYVEMYDVKDNGSVSMAVAIENRDESDGIILFHQAYDEKTLKKSKIRFAKEYPGAKGKRTVLPCLKIDKTYDLSPDHRCLIQLSGMDGNVSDCIIPLYVISYKTNSKGRLVRRTIIEQQVIELQVEVELKPEPIYYELNDAVHALKAETDTVVFCNNPKHEPSFEMQKAVYQVKIDSLNHVIDSIIRSHNWFSSDKRFIEYKEIKDILSGIDLNKNVEDCGQHIEVHQCRYCNRSLEDIHHRMEDIYMQILASVDRKKTKREYIGEVNSMYRCVLRRNQSGKQKDRIKEYFNRINQL